MKNRYQKFLPSFGCQKFATTCQCHSQEGGESIEKYYMHTYTAILIYFVQNGWIQNDGNILLRKYLLKNITPRRGIEPGSPAYQAGILTTTLSRIRKYFHIKYQFNHCKMVALYLASTSVRPTFWYGSTGPLETKFQLYVRFCIKRRFLCYSKLRY